MNKKSCKDIDENPESSMLHHVRKKHDARYLKSAIVIRKMEFHYLRCKQELTCIECSDYLKFMLEKSVHHATKCSVGDCKVRACSYLKEYLKNTSGKKFLQKLEKLPILTQKTLEELVKPSKLDVIDAATQDLIRCFIKNPSKKYAKKPQLVKTKPVQRKINLVISNLKSKHGYPLTAKQASMFCSKSNPIQLTLDQYINTVPKVELKKVVCSVFSTPSKLKLVSKQTDN